MPSGVYVRTEEHLRKLRKSKKPRTPEHCENLSKSHKGKHPSEEALKNMSISHLGQIQNEEINRNRSEKLKGRKPWNKGLTKEIDNRIKRWSETRTGTKRPKGWLHWSKGLTKETDNRIKKAAEKRKGEKQSEKTKRKRSETAKLNGSQRGENNPMFGRKGDKAPRWQGGISKLPYGFDFNEELKNRIREKFNHTCVLCGKWGNCPHHIDYDKMNNKEENFVLLCRSDNGRVNKNRIQWEIYFRLFLLSRGEKC
jgi:hypothetical protein